MSHIDINSEAQPVAPSEFPFHELAQLQTQLDHLRAKLWEAPKQFPRQIADEGVLQRLAGEIIRSRRRREKIFGKDLFGEPAWDILLEICAAEWKGQKLSVTGACYASAVPPTTALRWIQRLESEGWLKRLCDPADGRRSWVAPTDTASVAMRNYLNSIAIRPA